MKKYYVISKNGNIYKPEKYLELDECPPEFKIVIEKEALNIRSKKPNSKPEYLKYANKMGFSWEENSEIGFISYNQKADLIMRLVKDYARMLVKKIGIPLYEVRGSNFFNMNYPVVEAYANLFGDRLFINKSGNKNLVMSYDASYPQFNLAKKFNLEEKDLPFMHFSISDCYRNEQSGECMLLFRGKRFFMPDLHPYCKDISEAFSLYSKLEKVLINAAKEVNQRYWNIIKVSSEKNWKKYREEIISIAKRKKSPALVELRVNEEEKYWIVDVDYSIVDQLEQVREIGCIQIDIGNAKRLGIEYSDSSGKKRNPVIIHSAIPGGIERYLYMLLNDFKNSFPFWLYPVQLRIIPISKSYVKEFYNFIDNYPDIRLRYEIDDRDLSVPKRIKFAYEDLVPEYLLFGEKEIKDSKNFIKKIFALSERNKGKPFLDYGWPKSISKQL
ncbi:MAG TPA: hypothetical protein ENN64_00890 [bacterium]|nr:hypothetical protein [bacterium]